MKKIRLGIIGVGHLGTFHVKVAKEIEEIELIGIYDLDNNKAQTIAESYKVKAYNNLEELLKETEAVSIVVPTTHHYQVASQCLEANCHLFIEKPITSTVEQAQEIIKKAKESQKKVQVGHIERFNPAFLSLKEIDLNPMFIEAHRLSQFNPRGTDVSVILDLMIHDLDLVLSMVKSELISVDACGVDVVSYGEDIANVRLKFANGCVANLTASRISVKKMRKMRIFQPNQYIALDFLNQQTEIFKLNNQSSSRLGFKVGEIGCANNKKDIFYLKPNIPNLNPLQEELKSFAKAILEDTTPIVSGEDGLRALKVANQILQQIQKPSPKIC